MADRDTSVHDADHPAGRAGHPEEDELGFELPKAKKITLTRIVALLIGLGVLVAAGYFIGYAPKHRAAEELSASTKADEHAIPRVEIVAPKAMASDRAIELPGSIQALEEATVNARADGFIKRWLVDIGDEVTDGQLLAEIETPEIDSQLIQARAQYAQTLAAVAQNKANRTLSKSNMERYKELAAEKMVSAADSEQRTAQYQVDDANVNAAEANVDAAAANIRRFEQLQGFAKVTAPFAGKITVRSIERGTLVVAGTTPLFRIAAMDPVRVFVQVPQDAAPGVEPDLSTVVTVREFAGKKFTGKVTRASGELDPTMRTMNVEIRVPNGDHKLLPGMYAQVAMTLPTPHQIFELPATAVYNDARGIRVATVDAGSKVHFVNVAIERDTGATIEIASGLSGTEKVLKLSNAGFVEGEDLEVMSAPKPEGSPAASASKS